MGLDTGFLTTKAAERVEPGSLGNAGCSPGR